MKNKVMKKKTKRDKKLITDYQSEKYDMAELVGMYEITPTRIYQILNYYDVPKNTDKEKKEKKGL